MKIKSYYILDKKIGKYVEVKDTLILKERKIYSPLSGTNTFPNPAPAEFIYDDGLYFRANIDDNLGKNIEVLKHIRIKEIEIVNDSHESQIWHNEFLIKKNFINHLLLKIMFKRHWIYTDYKFYIPLILSIISLAFSIRNYLIN